MHNSQQTNSSESSRLYVPTGIAPENLFQELGQLRVGSLRLDLVDRTARRGGRSIELRPREFHLLKYMMQRCGQLLTRAELLKDVWSYKFVPESMILVDVHMGKLRRKIDGPNETPMIRTLRGAGFILNATHSQRLSTVAA